MAGAAPMLLASLLVSQNPSWPSADPDLPPEALARGQHMPGDPDYAPRPDPVAGCAGQTALYSFTPECTAAIDPDERALGSGVHADRAWLLTIGGPGGVIAFADTGADFDDPELAGRWRLNAGELPAPRTSTRGAGRHDRNGDGAFTVRDYTSATGTAAPSIATVVDLELISRGDRGDANGNGLLDPQDLILIFSDGADDDRNGLADDVAGWDLLDGDNDPSDPAGPGGHGAHQARVALAEANNGIAGAGVCPACTAIAIRAGTAEVARAASMAEAVRIAAAYGAKVIAAGLLPFERGGAEALAAAVVEASDLGALVVAPAGNTSSAQADGPWDPGRVLVVGSIGYDDAARDRATSAVAPDTCSSHGVGVVAVAPGRCDEDAAAIAAGVAGLVFSAGAGIEGRAVAPISPPLTSQDVLHLLSMTAAPLAPGSLPGKFAERSGHGRLDARAAVEAVIRRAVPASAAITSPARGTMVDPTSGAPFPVEGVVSNERHAEADWLLEYASGLAPPAEAFSAIASGTLARGESLRVRAEVPSSGLVRDPTAPPPSPADPAITVRLSISARAGGEVVRATARRAVFAHRDLYLLPAFPVALGAAVYGGPRALDLDADGSEEIVVATGDGRIHAVEATGTVLDGWPVSVRSGGVLAGAIAAADLGEGSLSIAAVTVSGEVSLFDAQGRLQPGFPAQVATSTSGPVAVGSGPVIEDLDGDGRLDILVSASAGSAGLLDAWNAEGVRLPGYPVRLPEPIGAAAVGDADGDGRIDVAVASHVQAYLLRGDGALGEDLPVLAGWPVAVGELPAGRELPRFSRAAGAPIGPPPDPILVRRKGLLDVVVTPVGRPAVIIDAAGRLSQAAASARSEIGRRARISSAGAAIFAAGGSPSAADLDGDGDLEVTGPAGTEAFVFGPPEGGLDVVEPMVSAWSLRNGTFAAGFPIPAGDRVRRGFAVADLDGDGRPEVIFGDGQFRLHAASTAGVSPRGWPKSTAGAVTGTPAIGDLDGDGRLEVVAATVEGLLFAWRTDARAEGRVPWEGARHDHRATANTETKTTERGDTGPGDDCSCRSARGDASVASWIATLLALAFRRRRHR